MGLTMPMTLIISFALLVCLAVGLALIFRSATSRGRNRNAQSGNAPEHVKECPHCHNTNPPDARFCARCGAKLDS